MIFDYDVIQGGRELIFQILGRLLQLFVLHHPPKLVDFFPTFIYRFERPAKNWVGQRTPQLKKNLYYIVVAGGNFNR